MYHLSLSPRLWRLATGRLLAALAPLVALTAFPVAVLAASPFTYQGRLNASGGPASGAHDFEFGLYGSTADADQVGTTVTVAGVVVDGGLFSVQLDFGDNAFNSPNRWLDITVRPQNNGAYTPLAPRQPVTPAPAAHHAFSIADGSVTASKMAPGAIGTSALDTTVTQALVPSESYIMTRSETAPVGYAYSGISGYISSGSWNANKASMPTKRSRLAAVAVNGKIYALGGVISEDSPQSVSVNEEYDPATNTWATKAPMPTARRHVSAAAANGKIYALGGESNDSFDQNKNEEYDPVTDTWAEKASMPTGRLGFAAAAVGGKIYILGGIYTDHLVEEYEPWTDTWTTKAPMPTARGFLAAAAANGKIYALGGRSRNNSNNLSVNEEYDPATNTWTTKTPMPTARQALAAAATDGKVYAIGGFINYDKALSLNEEYDVATNTWAVKDPMPTARKSLAAATASGKIYALGGDSENADYYEIRLATNEEYSVPVLFYYHRKN